MPITNSNITLRQLRAFLAVAEELSFSRASERLAVSTPWLSETVKDLEGQLKVTLFERTTRSVQLTEAGRVFSGLIAQVLDDLDDAIQVAQRVTARPGRALTLGYVIGAGLELLPRLVRIYLDRHPDQCRIRLHRSHRRPARPRCRRRHRPPAHRAGRHRDPRPDHRAEGRLPSRTPPPSPPLVETARELATPESA